MLTGICEGCPVQEPCAQERDRCRAESRRADESGWQFTGVWAGQAYAAGKPRLTRGRT